MPLRRMTKITSNPPVKNKPVPRRTCVVCRQVKDKRKMIRLVKTPEGIIEIDINNKKNGRGAYLCPVKECFQKALKGKQLENTLRSSLTAEIREQLLKLGEDLPGGIN